MGESCPLCHTYLPYLPYETFLQTLNLDIWIARSKQFSCTEPAESIPQGVMPYLLTILTIWESRGHYAILTYHTYHMGLFTIMPYLLTTLTIWDFSPLCHTYLPHLPYGTFHHFAILTYHIYYMGESCPLCYSYLPYLPYGTFLQTMTLDICILTYIWESGRPFLRESIFIDFYSFFNDFNWFFIDFYWFFIDFPLCIPFSHTYLLMGLRQSSGSQISLIFIDFSIILNDFSLIFIDFSLIFRFHPYAIHTYLHTYIWESGRPAGLIRMPYIHT